jgi:CBS domain containing-hemolysin-like protein
MSTEWLMVIFSMIACAFFSGLEIAFLTSNKLRIELESKQGAISGKILAYFIKKQSNYIATMLVGNSISLVIFGLYMSAILTPLVARHVHSHVLVLIIQTFLSTMFILITAEFIPKNLFRINPNGVLNFFALPLIIAYWLLSPVVFLSIGISHFFLEKVMRVKTTNDEIAFGRIDLDNLVRESTSRITEKQELEHEVQIFKNALGFSEIRVRECMIPRTEIVATEVNDSIEKLNARFVETRLSKILVYEQTIDHIIGYTHSYELFKKPQTIREILRPVLIVPETMPVNEVLTLFIQQHKSIAIVVDEFGGTSGMLAMEDVMEEIFGEIDDEHDKEELIDKKITDKEFYFSARLEVDYLNTKYHFNLPVGEDHETLGGVILNNLGSIPRKNDVIRVGKFVFKIVSVANTKIEQVIMKVED